MKTYLKSVRNQLIQQVTAKAIAAVANEIDNKLVKELITTHSGQIQTIIARVTK